ncbi:hypothetical protein [Xanthomonas pisi]|uniref:hypothetical protein n=1 Tax=Xanthomonas pisi TaxID=56457 RepID=UPI0011B03D0C|nr:hypothetical protein [Xanthomonas pisi]
MQLTFGDAQGLVAPIARYDTDHLRRDHHASIGKMVEQPRSAAASAAAQEMTLIRALASVRRRFRSGREHPLNSELEVFLCSATVALSAIARRDGSSWISLKDRLRRARSADGNIL